jgi:hypothetical protein
MSLGGWLLADLRLAKAVQGKADAEEHVVARHVPDWGGLLFDSRLSTRDDGILSDFSGDAIDRTAHLRGPP